MKKLVLTLTATVAAASLAVAGSGFDGKSSKSFKGGVPAPQPCFSAGEAIFGLFGGYAIVDSTNEGYDDSFAGGAELLYAVTNNVVIGAEYYAFSSEPAHAYNGVLQLRFPTDCLAPYVFGTVGGIVDGENVFSVGGGAGLEYRLSPQIGLFGDGRYVYGDGGDETSVFVRAGLRFAF
ncbi:MAG: hypothetical protein SNJ52_01575 [Verrucomicrobiia bacterium]